MSIERALVLLLETLLLRHLWPFSHVHWLFSSFAALSSRGLDLLLLLKWNYTGAVPRSLEVVLVLVHHNGPWWPYLVAQSRYLAFRLIGTKLGLHQHGRNLLRGGSHHASTSGSNTGLLPHLLTIWLHLRLRLGSNSNLDVPPSGSVVSYGASSHWAGWSVILSAAVWSVAPVILAPRGIRLRPNTGSLSSSWVLFVLL
jgi:hypothetical protein